jgi:hypothetical protein
MYILSIKQQVLEIYFQILFLKDPHKNTVKKHILCRGKIIEQ